MYPRTASYSPLTYFSTSSGLMYLLSNVFLFIVNFSLMWQTTFYLNRFSQKELQTCIHNSHLNICFSFSVIPRCMFIPPYICLIHGIFSGGCHPPNFPFFKIYEAFDPFSVSFFCFGFNHSSSEKLQSLISPDHLSGCFSFAFAYTSFRFSNISRSSPLCLYSGVT